MYKNFKAFVARSKRSDSPEGGIRWIFDETRRSVQWNPGAKCIGEST